MPTATLTTPTRLRINRRGRAVLSGLVLVPVVAAVVAFGLNSGPALAGDDSSAAAQLTTVSVGAGESLWSIAESVAPDRDPRDVIADIIKLNGLDSANVPAGTSLAIPSY